MPDRICAIHQPNFLPWLGYFDKINKSDVFIIMDNVQFPKTGGVWTNRVKIAVKSKAHWLTVPIARNYHGVRLIKDMEINNITQWRTRIIKTIEHNYKKCPFFKDEWEYITTLLSYDTPSLSEFNIHAIVSLTDYLGFNISKFVIGSSLKSGGNATNLLISMSKAVDGFAYMCGAGAGDYQEDEKFTMAGIKLKYQNFKHMIYKQYNTQQFIPGLSILDSLFNCGKKTVREFLEKSRQSWQN